MKIQLDDTWWLINDPENLVLATKNVRKRRGKVVEELRAEYFYPDIPSLCRGYLKRKTLDSSATTLEELGEEVQATMDKIDEMKNNIEAALLA